MASLLSAKQVGALLKTKRKQYVESVVGLGSAIVLPPGAPAGSVGVLTRRKPAVLVFAVKSLPARQMLAARNAFRDVAKLQLRKVPNGVVKAAARDTPFELMMVGPSIIATPLPGRAPPSLPELVASARQLVEHPAVSKGLLFTGLVHDNVYMNAARLASVDFEEPKKVVSLVAGPAVGILQSLNFARIPTIAMLQTYHHKLAKEGNMDAVKALGLTQ